MKKGLFQDALNYIDRKNVEEHIAKKQELSERSTASARGREVSSFIKRPIGILAAALLIAAAIGSVVVAAIIIKNKNVFQTAHDLGTSVYEVDTEGNMKYTPVTEDSITDTEAGKTNNVGERFDDPKTDIYCKMLNTIDNIGLLELKMKTDQLGEGETEFVYKIDIDGGRANQICYENGEIAFETFTKDGYVVLVDHRSKTYDDKYMPVLSREDSPYIPLKDRIRENTEDGIPLFDRRANITNCPFAEYCIVPQELAFSYLKDFDKWDVTGETEYLGRKCTAIEGEAAPYYAEKHGGDIFRMTVDSETGVLMSFEVLSGEETTGYMHVTECSFGASPDVVPFDPDDYPGYERVTRASAD